MHLKENEKVEAFLFGATRLLFHRLLFLKFFLKLGARFKTGSFETHGSIGPCYAMGAGENQPAKRAGAM